MVLFLRIESCAWFVMEAGVVAKDMYDYKIYIDLLVKVRINEIKD